MTRLLRAELLSLACLMAAGVVGVAAIADHSNKQRRLNRAQEAEWYCVHRGTRCDGPSSASIEDHWQQRQWGYEIAVVLLGGFGLGRLAYRVVRR